MQNDMERLFAAIGDSPVPDSLTEGIMRRLEIEKNRQRASWHVALFSVVSFLSGIGAVFAWQAAGAQMANSGFSQYAGLILTDAASLMAHWDSFLFAAAESFPVASAAALLASIVMFAASSRHLFRDARAIFTRHLIA